MKNEVIVIGGGPAGMMAAYAAAAAGKSVLLLEKNEMLGKKLYITGKGRCNITNACDVPDFFSHVVRNPKFLMSAVYGLSGGALVSLLNENGLETKVERGLRVFPASDRSGDVIDTLKKMMRAAGARWKPRAEVRGIVCERGGFRVAAQDGDERAAAVVIATGGLSYPSTGSTGDGYAWARGMGHKLQPRFPALVPLADDSGFCARMQGLTLKNVGFSLFQDDKRVYAERGEMLFTHFGLSGPVVLSASSYIDHAKGRGVLYGMVDLKPALDEQKLEARLLRDFSGGRQLGNYMPALLPSKLAEPFLESAGLSGEVRLNEITREERRKLLRALKNFRITLSGVRPFTEAVVTGGGVDVASVDPSTMESKIVPGLFFAGEVLDVSAQTGGFNLQIAFSTGRLAGASAARR